MNKPNRIVETQFHSLNIQLTYTPDYFVYEGTSLHHIAVEVDGRYPIPATRTGYRSHFFKYPIAVLATDAEIIEIFNSINDSVQQLGFDI